MKNTATARVQKRSLLILVLAVVALAVVAIYTRQPKAQAPSDSRVVNRPAEEVAPTATPAKSESGNITVDQPRNGSRIQNGTIIKGTARVFENSLNFRLTSASSGRIAEGFTTACCNDTGEFSPYSFELAFTKQPPFGDTGTLEVFSYSAKDGSEINKVIITVKF